MINQSWGDVAFLAVVLSTHHHIRALDVSHQAVECTLVDNAHKVLRLLGIGTMQTGKFLLQRTDELFLDIGMHQQIVGCNASLTGIETLSPSNSAGSHGEVGILVHDARALSPQFEYHGSEMLGRGTHHLSSQIRTSREEDDVESLFQESSIHLPVALHDGNEFGAERFLDHLLQHLGYMRHIRRRLQDSRASRRNGTHQRVEQKLYGVVPRSHDEGASQRFGHHLAAGRHHLDGSRHRLRSHPKLQMTEMVVYLAHHDAQFGHVGLFITLVKVFPQGLGNAGFP